jgi:hypothetical protein
MDYKLLNMINKASESASDQFLLIDDVEEAINFGIGQYDFSSLISADFLQWCEIQYPRAHSEALDIANQYGDTSEDDIADHALYFVVGETMDVLLRSQK